MRKEKNKEEYASELVPEHAWWKQTKKEYGKQYRKSNIWRRQAKNKTMHERILERMQKTPVQQCVEENLKNDAVKSVGVDVVTKFIKDEAETSIDDANVDFDNDVDDQ